MTIEIQSAQIGHGSQVMHWHSVTQGQNSPRGLAYRTRMVHNYSAVVQVAYSARHATGSVQVKQHCPEAHSDTLCRLQPQRTQSVDGAQAVGKNLATSTAARVARNGSARNVPNRVPINARASQPRAWAQTQAAPMTQILKQERQGHHPSTEPRRELAPIGPAGSAKHWPTAVKAQLGHTTVMLASNGPQRTHKNWRQLTAGKMIPGELVAPAQRKSEPVQSTNTTKQPSCRGTKHSSPRHTMTMARNTN